MGSSFKSGKRSRLKLREETGKSVFLCGEEIKNHQIKKCSCEMKRKTAGRG